MTAKHTPGPWIIMGDGLFKNPGIDSVPDSLSIIEVGHKHKGIIGRTPEETSANAHLIAAAPELLEACETLMHELAVEGGSGHWALEKAELAIAKAKGEAGA